MPRKARRLPPSKRRPGDDLVKLLRKKLPRYMGYQAQPNVLYTDPGPPGALCGRIEADLPTPVRPRLLRESPVGPTLPNIRRIQTPLRSDPEPLGSRTPQRLGAAGVPELEKPESRGFNATQTPPPTLRFAGEATDSPEQNQGPVPMDAPVCPLLGQECLADFCVWWDGISRCSLVNLVQETSALAGRLQGLQDWLQYRLGDDPPQ